MTVSQPAVSDDWSIPQKILLKLQGGRSGEPKPFDGTETPAFGRTLSIALAMKGGVSLAAWIGGAVSEIDILRRIRIVKHGKTPVAYFIADQWTRRAPSTTDPDPRADPAQVAAHRRELEQTLLRADQYARVLVSRGYDSVEVDVLAGASAGGLNAVLYSVAQRAGVSVDPLLSLWTGSGSVWRLLRTPGFASVPSVLMGDAFFWKEVRKAIHGFYGWLGNPFAVAPELTVDLSATISDRQYLTSAGAHEGRGHFHFVGVNRELMDTDLLADDAADPTIGRSVPQVDDDTSTNRLAYAARTTSSFPGAFEQARIWSHQSTVTAVPADDSVDMSFAFSAHRAAGQDGVAVPYQVLDGGVLDNIPIDRLTRAIRDRTPRTYGDRIAIYLDPSPDALPLSARKAVASSPPHPSGPNHPGRQSFLGTIGNGVFMRGISESEGDEIAALDEQHEAALYAAARAASFAQSARQLVSLTAAAAGNLAQSRSTYYVLYRAVSDADLLKRVLGNPDLWQLTTDLTTRDVLPTMPDSLLRTLDESFASRYVAATTEAESLAAIRFGSQGLRDAGLCALDWMRDLEDFASSRGSTPAFEAQRDGLRTRLHRIARQALRLRDERTRAVLLALNTSPTAATVLTQWLQPNDPQLAGLWRALGSEVARLRAFATSLGAAAADPADGSSPWRWFPQNGSAVDLAPFVAADGIPDSVQLKQFAQITAAEKTPFHAAFAPLAAAQRAEIVSGWLALPRGRFQSEAVPSQIHALKLDPGAKLAGSILGNFGAFFSRTWRVNDWWWGRLDASAGVVRVLQSLPQRPGAGPISTTATTKLQTAILRQAAGASPLIRPFRLSTLSSASDPAVIAENMSAGAHTLAQLRPGYLVTIASRAARIALRAIRSGQNPIIKTAATVLLPPILAIVAMVFTPLRLAFLVSALFAVLPWTAEMPHSVPADSPLAALPGWLLLAAVLGVSGLHWWGVVASILRIAALRKRLNGPEVLDALQPKIRAARTASLVLAGLSIAALVLLALRTFDGRQVDASTVFLAGAAVCIAVAARSASRKLNAGSLRAEHVVLVVLTGLAIWAILEPAVLARPVHAIESAAAHFLPANAAPALLVAIAMAIVQAVLSWGWLGGLTTPKQAIGLIAVVLSSAVVGAASGGVVLLVSLTQHGHAVPGLLTGLAVWFVASHLCWWNGELPWGIGQDIDDPRFAKPPTP
ncbi:MAG: DUF3376 domain-containing protein [Pseudolysinimonas sp.]